MSNLKLAAATEIKIEKGVPLSGTNGGPKPRYPLAHMEVGDSFFVDAHDEKKIRNAVGNINRSIATRDKKFTVRKQDDGSIRCWRTA